MLSRPCSGQQYPSLVCLDCFVDGVPYYPDPFSLWLVGVIACLIFVN